MTIVASVKVRDGLILGTDSMTQISAPTEQGPQLLKSYSHARKLFRLSETFAVATYGLGNIGNRSIEGLVLEFSRTGPARNAPTVASLAEALHAFVRPQYDSQFAEGSEE